MTLVKDKFLDVELAGSGEADQFLWNDAIVKKFNFDEADIAKLENDEVLFRDQVAYSLTSESVEYATGNDEDDEESEDDDEDDEDEDEDEESEDEEE